jgi:DNA-binding transcriptional LysR family regulator
MIPNLDVDQLKTFLAIADTGSFTKAAEDVNKTQSAVSMQMKRLEETIGRALFARDGRGSKLSEEGERFIDSARRFVAINDEIVSTYTRPAISGTVRFGTPDDYADLFLPEVLARFSRTHPFVNVDVECISSTNLSGRVKRGELDLALVSFCGCASDENGEVIRSDELRWVGSQRHSAHAQATLPLAAGDAACAWRKQSVDALHSVGKAYRVAYTSPNRSAIDSAVLQGLAVAVMPEICIRPGMRILNESEGFPKLGVIEIGLMKKPGKLSSAAEALAAHVRESFGKPTAGVIAAE